MDRFVPSLASKAEIMRWVARMLEDSSEIHPTRDHARNMKHFASLLRQYSSNET